MRTRAQTIRLGAFVAVALGLLIGLLVVLSGSTLLEPRDRYTILFSETVSGLEVGAPVKLLGVRVGRIESFRVRSLGVDKVEVDVSLDHETPIRSDAVAQLSGSGLTGLLFVEITGGTSEAELIPPGGTIPAGPSLLGTLTGKAESIAIKTEEALNRILYMTNEKNVVNFDRTLEHIVAATARMNEVLESVAAERERIGPLMTDLDEAAVAVRDAGRELGALGADGRTATANLTAMTAQDGALHALLTQSRQSLETFDAVLGGVNASRTAQDVRDALRSFTRAMNQLNTVVAGSSADVRAISASMRDTAEHLEEFAQTIREDPSLIIRPTREQ